MSMASVIVTSHIMEMPARLGWKVMCSEIIHDDPPYIVMLSSPDFPCCNDKLYELGIVWDVHALIDSVKRPGSYQLLTCDCGYAPDAELNEAVQVCHPDADTIIWEIDVPGLRSALDASFAAITYGYIRLVFRREEYDADLRTMVCELQLCGTSQFPVDATHADCGLINQIDAGKAPRGATFAVEDLEPNIKGVALERLLATDAKAAWEREPVWPRGTVVEFGFFTKNEGHDLMKVNGQFCSGCWPGWYFTRWQALDAFKIWLSFTKRAIYCKNRPAGARTNEFVLLQEDDRALCHMAGRRFAEVMQCCLDEGCTAPGVTVIYVESALLCV